MTSLKPAPGTARTRRRRGLAALPFLGPGGLYLAALFVVPLVLITSYAFFQRGRFGGIVWDFTLDNFVRLLDPLYLGVVGNSLKVAFIVTLLALLLGYPTALAITRLSPTSRGPGTYPSGRRSSTSSSFNCWRSRPTVLRSMSSVLARPLGPTGSALSTAASITRMMRAARL